MLFYDFPEIYTIGDVLPHIEGREEFCVADRGEYKVINYLVSFEETFVWDNEDPIGSAIRRECRGLTFNSSGKLISRKYHKFFNVNEKEETQENKINLYEPHIILEKLDGSLISAQKTEDGFCLTTKMGETEISSQAEEFIQDKLDYSKFIQACLDADLTPLFEWCSRKNRIVIDYPEDNLILTGVRSLHTGGYKPYGKLLSYGKAFKIPVVKAIHRSSQNVHLFIQQIREWEDEEGVILRFDNGHMLKIKADQYVLRHKAKDAINFEKNVLKIIIADEVDDVIPLLTQADGERLHQFQKAFWEGVNEVCFNVAELFVKGNRQFPEKKDFAVEFVEKQVPSHLKHIMYGLKMGRCSREIVLSMIEKSLTSQTKVDENRWLFGGICWNSPF